MLITIIIDLDLFEVAITTLEGLEKFEVDEFIIPIMIFGFFAFFDLIRRQRSHKIEFEKIEIYKAMMSSTHHILNNFLNQIQLFKMTAEDTPGFDPEVLTLYDQTIEEASVQIDALGSVTNINELSIRASVAPQPNTRVSTQQDVADVDKPRR